MIHFQAMERYTLDIRLTCTNLSEMWSIANIASLPRDPELFQQVESIGGEVQIRTKRDKGLARLDLVGSQKEGGHRIRHFRLRISPNGGYK